MNGFYPRLVRFIDEEGTICAAIVVSSQEEAANLHVFHPEAGGSRFVQNVTQQTTKGQRLCWSDKPEEWFTDGN